MQDDLREAVEKRALVAFLWFVAARVAITQANDVRPAFEREFDGVHRRGNFAALGIHCPHRHRHGVASIARYGIPVRHKFQ